MTAGVLLFPLGFWWWGAYDGRPWWPVPTLWMIRIYAVVKGPGLDGPFAQSVREEIVVRRYAPSDSWSPDRWSSEAGNAMARTVMDDLPGCIQVPKRWVRGLPFPVMLNREAFKQPIYFRYETVLTVTAGGNAVSFSQRDVFVSPAIMETNAAMPRPTKFIDPAPGTSPITLDLAGSYPAKTVRSENVPAWERHETLIVPITYVDRLTDLLPAAPASATKAFEEKWAPMFCQGGVIIRYPKVAELDNVSLGFRVELRRGGRCYRGFAHLDNNPLQTFAEAQFIPLEDVGVAPGASESESDPWVWVVTSDDAMAALGVEYQCKTAWLGSFEVLANTPSETQLQSMTRQADVTTP